MAVPTKRRPQIKIITASAMKVRPSKPSTYRDRQTLSWQHKAFLYSRLIPELNYASRFYAKMLKKLRIYPALRSPNDETEPITEGLPVELLDRIQDPGGGRSQILSSYGRLMFLIGDGYLFGRDIGKPVERWSFVNPDELQITEKGIAWKPTQSSEAIPLPRGSAEAYRMWTPDPEFSGEAESPMRAAIEIAEELDLLTKAVRTTAVSRMLNGLLKVPQELSFGADTPGLDDDPEENPFLQEMIDHITGVLENPGSAEAGGPWIAEGAAEYLDGLEWIPLHNPATDYLERELRREAIDRLAIGMDMPPEILKGMAEANHWGARQIMHDTWRSHGSGVAEQFCDDLADAYLRPALLDAGYENWDKVVIAYDDSNVVVPPDRTDDADKAYDRGNVSDIGYRQMKGIPESQAPSDEEKRIWLAVKLRDTSFLEGTPFEVKKPEPQDMPPGPEPSTDAPGDAEEGPPAPGPAGVSRQESRAAIVRGAAELALYRCREVAGSRIRTQIRNRSRNAPELALIEGESNCNVAAILGQKRLGNYDLGQPVQLVRTGADGFCALLEGWGFAREQAKVLADMIVVYAARTLFDPALPSLPPGFLAQVERLRDVAIEEAIIEHNNDSLARLTEILPGSIIRGG
jgi:hypothetical protein